METTMPPNATICELRPTLAPSTGHSAKAHALQVDTRHNVMYNTIGNEVSGQERSERATGDTRKQKNRRASVIM